MSGGQVWVGILQWMVDSEGNSSDLYPFKELTALPAHWDTQKTIPQSHFSLFETISVERQFQLKPSPKWSRGTDRGNFWQPQTGLMLAIMTVQ